MDLAKNLQLFDGFRKMKLKDKKKKGTHSGSSTHLVKYYETAVQYGQQKLVVISLVNKILLLPNSGTLTTNLTTLVFFNSS